MWLQTANPQAAAAALEAGLDTLVLCCDPGPPPPWAAGFTTVLHVGPAAGPGGAATLTDGRTGEAVGTRHPIADAAAASALAARLRQGEGGGPARPSLPSPPIAWAAAPPGAWSLIPAENLVAARRQGGGVGGAPRLFVSASTPAEAAGLLGALEAGADGVVLVTDDPGVARAGGSLLAALLSPPPRLPLVPALVTHAAPAGMGDRVCVDLTTAMAPGEGLLVGSFARGLALVQAEVESGAGYVGTRPFRVNAGALHSYVAAPGGRTAYLAELAAGDEVLIVDGASGATRPGVVGRAKVERRPLVRVTLAVVPPAGRAPCPADTLSVILQNAETVRLVGPLAAPLPPAAAEVVRWVRGGGVKGPDGPVSPPPPAARLGRSESEALRWAMHSTDDDSSGDEEGGGGEGGGGEGGASAPHVAAPPAAADALAWMMRDQDGDGLPDDADVDVSGMGEALESAGREGGGQGEEGGGEAAPLKARTSGSASVASLVPGVTAVWAWQGPPARHTGLRVEEAIEER